MCEPRLFRVPLLDLSETYLLMGELLLSPPEYLELARALLGLEVPKFLQVVKRLTKKMYWAFQKGGEKTEFWIEREVSRVGFANLHLQSHEGSRYQDQGAQRLSTLARYVSEVLIGGAG